MQLQMLTFVLCIVQWPALQNEYQFLANFEKQKQYHRFDFIVHCNYVLYAIFITTGSKNGAQDSVCHL